jgi:hypothetical protein
MNRTTPVVDDDARMERSSDCYPEGETGSKSWEPGQITP